MSEDPREPRTAQRIAGIAALNRASERDARDALRRCCASAHWVREMLAGRPFEDADELRASAERAADALTRSDWLEAFAAHPRIGDRNVSGRERGEQSGVDPADQAVLDALADGNVEYERRFGFVFLICATGRSGREMLTDLQRRLDADPSEEWRVAAGEQRKITALRLDGLLDEWAAMPRPGSAPV
jgi:2-oxo-4-hydroxy-4-carboxy-5-ureidoimidazoline decarboxylase